MNKNSAGLDQQLCGNGGKALLGSCTSTTHFGDRSNSMPRIETIDPPPVAQQNHCTNLKRVDEETADTIGIITSATNCCESSCNNRVGVKITAGTGFVGKTQGITSFQQDHLTNIKSRTEVRCLNL